MGVIGAGLWEVRTSFAGAAGSLASYSVFSRAVFWSFTFIKTQKISPDDLALARRRSHEFEK